MSAVMWMRDFNVTFAQAIMCPNIWKPIQQINLDLCIGFTAQRAMEKIVQDTSWALFDEGQLFTANYRMTKLNLNHVSQCAAACAVEYSCKFYQYLKNNCTLWNY